MGLVAVLGCVMNGSAVVVHLTAWSFSLDWLVLILHESGPHPAQYVQWEYIYIYVHPIYNFVFIAGDDMCCRDVIDDMHNILYTLHTTIWCIYYVVCSYYILGLKNILNFHIYIVTYILRFSLYPLLSWKIIRFWMHPSSIVSRLASV